MNSCLFFSKGALAFLAGEGPAAAALREGGWDQAGEVSWARRKGGCVWVVRLGAGDPGVDKEDLRDCWGWSCERGCKLAGLHACVGQACSRRAPLHVSSPSPTAAALRLGLGVWG